ncbi:MAG: preprotein translocase subunit YajC [Phycisphaerae bacterium]
MKTYAIVAQEEAPKGPTEGENGPPTGGGLNMLIMMVLIFGVFYLLLIRPQRKREKERKLKRQEMLDALKKNDHVTTVGGIRGVVSSIGDKEVVLKVDESKDVRLRVSRDAISKVGDLDEKGEGEDERK